MRVVESSPKTLAGSTFASFALVNFAVLFIKLDLSHINFRQPQVVLRSKTFSNVCLSMMIPILLAVKLKVWIMFSRVMQVMCGACRVVQHELQQTVWFAKGETKLVVEAVDRSNGLINVESSTKCCRIAPTDCFLTCAEC